MHTDINQPNDMFRTAIPEGPHCAAPILWMDLNPAVKRKIKSLEKDLNKKFYKAWSFTNPRKEIFLVGGFGSLKDDFIVAAIAKANPFCIGGWQPI